MSESITQVTEKEASHYCNHHNVLFVTQLKPFPSASSEHQLYRRYADLQTVIIQIIQVSKMINVRESEREIHFISTIFTVYKIKFLHL